MAAHTSTTRHARRAEKGVTGAGFLFAVGDPSRRPMPGPRAEAGLENRLARVSRRWTGGRNRVDPQPESRRWSHNLAYHRFVLDAVPTGARRALDVGCGEGVLSRRLQWLADDVIGLDPDPAILETARAAGGSVRYRVRDFLRADLEGVDFIACVAALHHMDERAALERMRGLLQPEGVLAIVGL